MNDYEAGEELRRAVDWRLRSWRQHPEYADMVGEAHRLGWEAYRWAERQGLISPLGAAIRIAAYGPYQWLRVWRGRRRPGSIRSEVCFVPLESAPEVETEAADAAALANLEAEQVWQWVLSCCKPAETEVLYRLYAAQESVIEAAAAMEMPAEVIEALHERGLQRCRTLRVGPFAEAAYQRCKNGHYLTPENQQPYRSGEHTYRRCRQCNRDGVRRVRGKQHVAAL